MAEAKRTRREAERLDVPGKRSQPMFRRNDDAFGQFAEKFARFMGTAKFLVYMTIFVGVWVVLNLVGLYGFRWDPYPFILLNLFFSTQASYAAPLILLADNRQEARDRVRLEEDRREVAQTRSDMDFLAREIASLRQSVGDLATRDYIRSELRNELRELLAELDGEARPRKKAKKAKADSVEQGAEN